MPAEKNDSSKQELDALFELSLDLLCIAGFDGFFKRLNPAWEKTLGFSSEDLCSKPFLDFVHPEDRNATAREARKLATGSGTVSFENRYLCRDGSYKWLEWSAFPSRQRKRIYAAARDITERKRTEEVLSQAQAQARYHELIQNAAYGIFRSTVEGRFIFANPALVDMLGYESEEELFALNIATDIYQDPGARGAIIEEAARSRRAVPTEVAWKRKDGQPITVRLAGRTVFDDSGTFAGFEAIAENVSERRLLEQQVYQLQKMESIGRLAGGIAHDFNNLLNVIMGHAQLLQEILGPEDPHKKRIDAIYKAGERAAILTRQLLAFGRRQVLEPRTVDLNSILADVEKLLRRLIGEDIDLRIVPDPALGQIRVDASQMGQVIMNLAVNARDAMPHGGTLTIETHNVELDASYAKFHIAVRPGPHVVLAVTDTGVGMDAETQGRIFEPFFTTKESGTGLGLATVYGIVKQSGGNIWVYSEPGRGATFKIYFPRIDALPEPAAAARRRETPRGSETILLVEDDDALRELAREFLGTGGYRVLEARNGKHALELAQRHPEAIHLLLTDMIMPGMRGSELAKELLAARPGIRVIFISGYTGDAFEQLGELESRAGFLVKPFMRESLLQKVRQVLDEPAAG